MGSHKILLCPCPDLKLDAQVLAEHLSQQGLEALILPPMCSPPGLAQLRLHLEQNGGEVLIAACGPDRNAGFFSRLMGDPPVSVVDLLAYNDLNTIVADLSLFRPPSPVPRPFFTDRKPSKAVLIIGGGVGGCQAALDLANAGLKVYLTDSSLSIGGTMAQLDKTFPTLDCSICILGPRLVEVATHPNIELLTYADIERLSGEQGNFEAELTLKPRYVDMSKCVGCGSCTEVCPVIVPSRWNIGLKPRKCIRIIFAQAVPLMATIEKDYCIDCRMCQTTCGRQAINLEEEPRRVRLQVGAVVLATGAQPFNPAIKGEYGYGRRRAVITNLEYERLVCASGPTLGSLVTPAGHRVERLAFVQCVGSRDKTFLSYCSGYCCTASIKEAMLALEHNPETEVTIFFNDIRTSGKGFEELYRRALQAGVRFVKGLPGRIDNTEDGRVDLHYEDLGTGRRHRLTVDLAVLAVGLTPPGAPLPFTGPAPRRDTLGFYASRHPILHPVESSVPGLFLAGTCQGPRDISETVCQASGVAGRIIRMFAVFETNGQGSASSYQLNDQIQKVMQVK